MNAKSLISLCDEEIAYEAETTLSTYDAVVDKSATNACDADVEVNAYDADRDDVANPATSAYKAYDAVAGTFNATSAINACEALVEVCAYDAEILASAVVACDAVTSRFEIKLPLPSVSCEPLIWTKPS